MLVLIKYNIAKKDINSGGRYQNASWDPASFNIKDATYSIALNPANIATFKGLSRKIEAS